MVYKMVSKQPTSERRLRTRERLVKAAAEVVAERGFHAASVDQIAERAGLSIGALYSNFAGKDDLLLAVFDNHVHWFEKQVTARLDEPDLGDTVMRWLTLTEESANQFLVFIEFWAYAVRKPNVRLQFAKRMEQMRSHVAAALEHRAEARASALPLPADLIALLGLAVGRGLALEQLADPDAVPNPAIAGLLTAFGGDS
ncbi:TetR/AcrR family transcriptional regulator [Kribbella sancticallisti]|uniref:TetR/AcrR family transcriptional regulator n=2 Tax=Kribbella sancticallisti TaxID=460087 RepID=A0ABN2DS17_9ACTN